jgi:hypothetical protein
LTGFRRACSRVFLATGHIGLTVVDLMATHVQDHQKYGDVDFYRQPTFTVMIMNDS